MSTVLVRQQLAANCEIKVELVSTKSQDIIRFCQREVFLVYM